MDTVCMRRVFTFLLVTVLAVSVAPLARVGTPEALAGPPNPVRRVKVTRDIVFPIVGATVSINGFGSCRDNCTREHHGVDILTYRWKGLPVVAAHDGVVTQIRDDGEWCNVQITGADGWYSRYVHLNNDSPGYDDENYRCLPPGMVLGDTVRAGQLIGWVGDSGNAENTQPHIHFEIRMPSGLPVDPLRSLKAARRITARQVGIGDPAMTAAEIALHAYPEGAPTVTLMAIDPYVAMLEDGYAPLELDGPLLLSEWEVIPQATLDAIDALSPSRIEVIGDLWMSEVLDQLRVDTNLLSLIEGSVATAREIRGRVVEVSAELETRSAVDYADEIGSAGTLSGGTKPPAPLSIVMLGDPQELGDAERVALSVLGERVAVTVMDFVDPEGSLGNAAFEGIGRSGSRSTLYYAVGEEWVRYRAREAPNDGPGYGVFVVEPQHLSVETIVFLSSIADAPVMPLWR